MSFSVSVKDSSVEYGGSGLNAIFATKQNLLNLKFLKMINEIINWSKKKELKIFGLKFFYQVSL